MRAKDVMNHIWDAMARALIGVSTLVKAFAGGQAVIVITRGAQEPAIEAMMGFHFGYCSLPPPGSVVGVNPVDGEEGDPVAFFSYFQACPVLPLKILGSVQIYDLTGQEIRIENGVICLGKTAGVSGRTVACVGDTVTVTVGGVVGTGTISAPTAPRLVKA